MRQTDHFPSPATATRRRPPPLRLLPAIGLLLALCIASSASMESAWSNELLSGDEVRGLIVGNTLQGSYRAFQLTMVWYEDGVVRGSLGLTGSDNGTWEIKDDLYCHEWATYFAGTPHCYRWRVQGDRYVLENRDAFKTVNIQGRIEKGMPPGY